MMDRLAKSLASWKPKLLALDARLAIIKHVLMVLPLYFMSVLELPVWAIKEIEKKCRGFLWKGDENARQLHCGSINSVYQSRTGLALDSGLMGALRTRAMVSLF